MTTSSSKILPAAKAVSDHAFSLAEESELAQAAFVESCRHFQNVLISVNFATQAPLEGAVLSLLDWHFQALTDLRDRAKYEPTFERIVPVLNELLATLDSFLETAHVVADGKLQKAVNELKVNDFRNYTDLIDLDAL
jgi:hypothetical protein